MSSRPSRGAARLAAILDALPDGLLLVNTNGTVVNANSIALESFEAPGTALVGRGLLDLLPEFDSRLIPGSMRRPDTVTDERGRTKPTRMTARRTDASEFPVEVTSANLSDGARDAVDPYGSSGGQSYSGSELLMLVVRDLSGAVDTEAELARSQRQTEMILRAASEGVVGTDTDGRIVLVNPAAAQILGFRASDLGGQELHPLILHSRPDGEPFPYEESPLADTLRSGRKHRVRGQVLWAKNGAKVPVDMTTAPVRDGDQLVGAVMTFADRSSVEKLSVEHAEEIARRDEAAEREREEHAAELRRVTEESAAELARVTEEGAAELARVREELGSELTSVREELTGELAAVREQHAEELSAEKERGAALAEREKDRYEALAARHTQLLAVLGQSLRGPLDELRHELSQLAADDAGQLWPEANQVLHHLAAGYSRMTTLVDNVLAYQTLDEGGSLLSRTNVMFDAVVAAGVDGAVELIGPGRVQFAVHAPPIEAEVDAGRLATALAHLIADVAGIDATGNARTPATPGYVDSTVVVAAAQRGANVRIEVRGPYSGGDPVHEPIVQGIVRAHGGVLQTHEMPGMSGSAYVLEVPIGTGAGVVPEGGPVPAAGIVPDVPEAGGVPDQEAGPSAAPGGEPANVSVEGSEATGSQEASAEASANLPAQATGGGSRRRRARRAAGPSTDAFLESSVSGAGQPTATPSSGTGRRRGRPAPEEAAAQGSVVTSAEHETASPALGETVPPQGVPAPTGRRARRAGGQEQAALPALPSGSTPEQGAEPAQGELELAGAGAGQPSGRRARRALGSSQPAQGTQDAQAPQNAQNAQGAHGRGQQARAQQAGPREVFALPPAEADRTPEAPAEAPAEANPVADADAEVRAEAQPGAQADVQAAPGDVSQDVQGAQDAKDAPQESGVQPQPQPLPLPDEAHQHDTAKAHPAQDHTPPQPHPAQPTPALGTPTTGGAGTALPPENKPGGRPVNKPEALAADQEQGQGRGQAQDQGQARAQAQASNQAQPQPTTQPAPQPEPEPATQPVAQPEPQPQPQPQPEPKSAPADESESAPTAPAESAPAPAAAQPLPAEAPKPQAQDQAPSGDTNSTQGRAFSVRTLGQGVPFGRQVSQQRRPQPPAPQPLPPQAPPRPNTAPQQSPAQGQAQGQTQGGSGTSGGTLGGSGRRRKLSNRQENRQESRQDGRKEQPDTGSTTQPPAQNTPQPNTPPQGTAPGTPPQGTQARPHPQPPLLSPNASEGGGRAYAIGAPDQDGVEGPEPLDGPGGAVEVANRPQPMPMDDELPPEPLDNPRRLLVWPAPDVATQQALSDRGYRPVTVHSREEVDAQIAAFPAALFVDPLTGPITRTALQSLRQAAVAAEVPVLVTAGLGQATREAAYGADPAVLLKALAPRDSEQHPPRVLLIEEHEEIALALTATLERRGMQVERAANDADAVAIASELRPNLVVMDLLQVRRRQAGIIDWLRANGQLNRTPLVVYTAAVEPAELPRLAAGETVLFLAERSTSTEVQGRIVDVLAKIGTN
ncbi:PAS domain-containing protein [Streptomyces sp. BH106]|uniref:PAS domain-containing protein n=1 Tax=Streptomyces sp. BH106 TaxID=3410409 RepID=UPI003CF75ACB